MYRNLSDKLVTCSGVVKHRSCHYFPALQLWNHTVLPRTISISNELSCTLEVCIKVLQVLNCISEGPFVDGFLLNNTTTNLSSHIPCIYRETLLGFLVQLRKTLWPSCLEQYTEKNTQGDYYACTLSIS